MTRDELPEIGEVFGQLMARVPETEQPLLLALAERLAAERYRDWAAQVSDPEQRAGLLACAAREEEIARRAETVHPDATSVQEKILAANPDLPEINRSLFAPFPLAAQMTLQARGERLGAGAWTAFAGRAKSEEIREAYLGCAPLEEENARFLESILGRSA